MRIAIIGGGAAGLACAWLLDDHHEVRVFERARSLGGHIRTLGRNLEGTPPEPGVYLDGGVVEFSRECFPKLHTLFARLSVPLRTVPGPTSMVLQSGEHLVSPAGIAGLPSLERLRCWARILPLAPQKERFLALGDLAGRTMEEVLTKDRFSLWMRLLTTYAWSVPFSEVGEVSAELGVEMLREFAKDQTWTSVVGGSYAYVEALLADLSGRVFTEAHVAEVTRSEAGVRLRMASGEVLAFDAVVFATPPDQVLALLGDATPEERARFSPWRANHVHTLIHSDPSPYARRDLHVSTEFDVFELAGGRGGYNARLDRLSGCLPGHPPAYSLAFGLDEEIDPAHVLARVEHHTPFYSKEAAQTRPAILANNGRRHTLVAGAWLGNGLHEAALESALEVAGKLGGKVLSAS